MFGPILKTLVAFFFATMCATFVCSSVITEISDSDPRPLCECGSNEKPLNTRVVGGHDAVEGLFPYATGLLQRYMKTGTDQRSELYSLTPYCGGTLITDRHVLTAAHCVRDRESREISLDIGDYDIESSADTHRYLRNARSLTKYPKYVSKTFNNDIALVELDKPVRLGSTVKSAWLPAPDSSLSPGTKVTVYGWGRLSYRGGGRPHILQSLELPLISNEDCQKRYITHITESMVCAGGEEGRDACIGDSGSGLTARMGNDYVLYGVVSFGKKCALPHVAGVYTRVSHFVNWIYNETKNASCQPCIATSENF